MLLLSFGHASTKSRQDGNSEAVQTRQEEIYSTNNGQDSISPGKMNISGDLQDTHPGLIIVFKGAK
jgi:hypothetical protein